VNSLAAIAGHEGDEEPWNFGEYAVQDDEVILELFPSHFIHFRFITAAS